MGVNKVEFGGEALIDLTSDTVMPQSLLRGYSAHNKAGELIEGLAVIPTVGNGTVTIKQNGANKGTFTMNQSGNTTIELTDNNTTYGAATQSTNGLMTAADKKKLDGLTPTTSLAVTQQGTSVLDGTVGKVLDDKIDAINSNLGGLSFGETEDGQPGFRKPGADTVIPFKQVDSGSGNVSSSAYYRIELGYRPKYFAGYAKNNSGGQGLGAFIFVDGASYQAENFWRIDDTGVTFSGHNWFYGVPILWISAK